MLHTHVHTHTHTHTNSLMTNFSTMDMCSLRVSFIFPFVASISASEPHNVHPTISLISHFLLLSLSLYLSHTSSLNPSPSHSLDLSLPIRCRTSRCLRCCSKIARYTSSLSLTRAFFSSSKTLGMNTNEDFHGTRSEREGGGRREGGRGREGGCKEGEGEGDLKRSVVTVIHIEIQDSVIR